MNISFQAAPTMNTNAAPKYDLGSSYEAAGSFINKTSSAACKSEGRDHFKLTACIGDTNCEFLVMGPTGKAPDEESLPSLV